MGVGTGPGHSHPKQDELLKAIEDFQEELTPVVVTISRGAPPRSVPVGAGTGD
ncbi:MAG: hypothetical protein ACYCW6_31020 [Candidatus Xenobia bacterium]